MTRNRGKMAKVFIAIISIAALAVVLAGGMWVVHQQLVEEKSGQWEPVMPITNDDSTPVIFTQPIFYQAPGTDPFSGPPPA